MKSFINHIQQLKHLGRTSAVAGLLFHCSSSNRTVLFQIDSANQSLISCRPLHARIIVSGRSLPTRIASELIDFYVDSGQIAYAREVFDAIPHSDPHRWTTLLSAYSRAGHHEEVLRAFREVQRDGAGPDIFLIPSVLKSCGKLSSLRAGESTHAIVLKHSMEDDPFVSCGLINMYSRCGAVERARAIFDGMPEKDLAVLNALISGYAQHGLMEEALTLVENVRSLQLKPDLMTWNSIISGFSHRGDASMVSKIFQMMMIDGFKPDIVSWTSVISGFVQNFRIHDAFRTFAEMLAHGICPNSATVSSILSACASLADVRRGKEIHRHAVAIGVERDVFVRSALVDMYAKCGFISHAKILFDRMSERSSVSWNSMIFGLANHGYCNESVETFVRMEKTDRERIDHLTFTAVMTACSHGGMTDFGRELFKKMQEVYRIKPRLEHYACMVDLLGRAGKLTEAQNMIKAMPMEPNSFVWGALLGACRIHGNLELAEMAAGHLAELEPQSPGSGLLLSGLYADAGGWGNVTRLKKIVQRRKPRKFLGRSWIEP